MCSLSLAGACSVVAMSGLTCLVSNLACWLASAHSVIFPTFKDFFLLKT
jgi:hypothetical protein